VDHELLVVGAAAVIALALWRLDVVGRIRTVLANLGRLTAKDDGETM
jgi:hypothetical protein